MARGEKRKGNELAKAKTPAAKTVAEDCQHPGLLHLFLAQPSPSGDITFTQRKEWGGAGGGSGFYFIFLGGV